MHRQEIYAFYAFYGHFVMIALGSKAALSARGNHLYLVLNRGPLSLLQITVINWWLRSI